MSEHAFVLCRKDYEYDDNNYYVNGSTPAVVYFTLEDAKDALIEITRNEVRNAKRLPALPLYGYYYSEEDLKEIFPGCASYISYNFEFPEDMTDDQIDRFLELISNHRDYYGSQVGDGLETPFFYLQRVELGGEVQRKGRNNTTDQLKQETPRKLIRNYD
jgi:hypothetical protein